VSKENQKRNLSGILLLFSAFVLFFGLLFSIFFFFWMSVWAGIKRKEIAIVTENFLNVLNIL